MKDGVVEMNVTKRAIEGRRVAQFHISREYFVDLIRGGGSPIQPDGKCRVVTCDLPDDFQLLHVEWNFAQGAVRVIGKSASFAEVEAGSALLPTITPMCRVDYEDPAVLADRARKAQVGL